MPATTSALPRRLRGMPSRILAFISSVSLPAAMSVPIRPGVTQLTRMPSILAKAMARELGISHAIRKLEATLRTVLSERKARAVHLTPASENPMRHAGAAFQLHRGLEEVAARGPSSCAFILRQALPRNG